MADLSGLLGFALLGVLVARGQGSKPTGRDFCLALDAALQRVVPGLDTAARLVVVAHWGLESGFGEKGKAYQRGWNGANLTAGSAWKGDKWTDVNGDTDGAGNSINQVWRIYPDLDSAVADYWSFLGPSENRGRYLVARFELQDGNGESFARELGAAGYYQLNPDEYVRRFTGAWRRAVQLFGTNGGNA